MAEETPMRVLVADDERISRYTTARQLTAAGFVAQAVESAAAALECLETSDWDVLLTDLRMPEVDGLELLRNVRERYPGVDVLVMTAFGTVETAVDAMRQGAADYLTKPFPFSELHARLFKLRENRAVRRELAALRMVVGADVSGMGLVGQCRAIREVGERIRMFAPHDAPVLIQGETGTGKEIVARALHNGGPRARRPFVAVPCGAIPRELAESTLFGHEKGAFTGAARRREGVFEQADGGTLLLDDVDDLPLDVQVKLLRVLQENKITRVGGDGEHAVDVRVVATTKIALREAVAVGRFREDAYFRLRGLELRLPPLRERPGDVLLLAQHFLTTAAARTGMQPATVSTAAAEILDGYPWPGNVRELRRTIESAQVMAAGGIIEAWHLPEDLRAATGRPRGAPFSLNLLPGVPIAMQELVHSFEEALVDWALTQSDGQQAGAADLLKLPRSTLQSKLALRRPHGGGTHTMDRGA
jgi:DNA-binding NtrC family response regulator